MANTESVSRDELIVCACGEREYSARDAIEAALFRGDAEPAWNEFMHRVGSEKQAEARELDLDEEAFDAAAEAFRYQHDLITAEETEQWLTTRGLSLDDFGGYFSRQCWGAAEMEDVDLPKTDYAAAALDLRELFLKDAVLSGELEHQITQLARRLAAKAAEKEAADPALVDAEKNKFLERNQMKPAELAKWLDQIGRDSEWFEAMAAMEAAYSRRASGLGGPQAQQKELSSLRLPLTRFETEMIELESRDAAQEALFCVREDGMSMEEVAKEGRYPYHRVDFVLADLPEEAQQRFLSVKPGQILDPVGHGDGFELCRICQRTEPDPNDPAVQERIEKRLLERHFGELTSKYVEWRLRSIISSE